VHGPVTDAPADSMTAEREVPANDGPEGLMTAGLEDREGTENVPPVHSATSGPESSETVPENRLGHAPEPVMTTGADPLEAATDAAPEASASSTVEGQDQPQSGHDQPTGQSSGWSKWKNKVKTFFQKLFA
jgi:hypothetical protein